MKLLQNKKSMFLIVILTLAILTPRIFTGLILLPVLLLEIGYDKFIQIYVNLCGGIFNTVVISALIFAFVMIYIGDKQLKRKDA